MPPPKVRQKELGWEGGGVIPGRGVVAPGAGWVGFEVLGGV